MNAERSCNFSQDHELTLEIVGCLCEWFWRAGNETGVPCSTDSNWTPSADSKAVCSCSLVHINKQCIFLQVILSKVDFLSTLTTFASLDLRSENTTNISLILVASLGSLSRTSSFSAAGCFRLKVNMVWAFPPAKARRGMVLFLGVLPSVFSGRWKPKQPASCCRNRIIKTLYTVGASYSIKFSSHARLGFGISKGRLKPSTGGALLTSQPRAHVNWNLIRSGHKQSGFHTCQHFPAASP